MFQEELGHSLQITVGRAMTLPELSPAETGRMAAASAEGAGSSATGRTVARKLS
jgi:hypothetical protein